MGGRERGGTVIGRVRCRRMRGERVERGERVRRVKVGRVRGEKEGERESERENGERVKG